VLGLGGGVISFPSLRPDFFQVEIPRIAQSFHQVPEASTVAMLLIGSALTWVVRVRRWRDV